MRIYKTIDVEYEIDAADVAEALEEARPEQRARILRMVDESRSIFTRHCYSETRVAERPIGPVTLHVHPDPVETIAIVSTCGRWAAHIGDTAAWRLGGLDWSALWRVSHIRTGLATSYRLPADEALSMLDELAALQFDDFGSLGKADGMPEEAKVGIKAVAARYRGEMTP